MRDLGVGVEVADVSETARAARIRVAVTCQPALTTWHDRLREACTGQDKTLLGQGAALATLIGVHRIYGYSATCFPPLLDALREGQLRSFVRNRGAPGRESAPGEPDSFISTASENEFTRKLALKFRGGSVQY